MNSLPEDQGLPSCPHLRAWPGQPALQPCRLLLPEPQMPVSPGKAAHRQAHGKRGIREVRPFSRAPFWVETSLVLFKLLPGPQPAALSFARCAPFCGHTRSSPLFDEKQRHCAHQSRALGSWWSLPTPVRLHGSPSPVTVFSLYFLLNFSSRFFFGLGKTHSFIGQVLHIIVTGSVKTSIKIAHNCACLMNLLNHVSARGQISASHESAGSCEPRICHGRLRRHVLCSRRSDPVFLLMLPPSA